MSSDLLLEAAPFPATKKSQKLAALAAFVAGFVLTTTYFVISQLLPDTGAAEFAYVPVPPDFQLLSAMRGFTLEQLINHVLRVLVLGPGLWLLALGMAPMLNLGKEPLPLPWLRRMPGVAAALSLLTTGCVMLFVLRGRAIVDDEITYATMAHNFTRGLLGEPRFRGQVLDMFEVLTKHGVTGKYLFGEPLVQMLGSLVSMPALAHLLLNALSLFALHKSVLLLWNDRALAACSCALLAISPMFVLCGATAQSQPTSLSCVLVGILGYALAEQRAPVRGGLLAGAAVGFGLSVRMQTLIPAGAVIGCYFIKLALSKRDARGLLSFAATGLLGVAAIAGYNWVLTGDALELPWFLQGSNVERYGFVQVWPERDFVHTPLGALQNLAVVAVRLNSWWLGWPLALLLLFRRAALARIYRAGALFIWVAVALLVFELGYYSPGVSDVGPIYHFELLPCLSVVAAQCLIELWRNRPELALTGVLVHVLFGTGSFVWEQCARLARMMHVVYDEPEHILAQMPAHSLLLVDPGCRLVLHMGWRHRPFAVMTHDPEASVLVYTRPSAKLADSFIAQFPTRACFFLDRNEQFEPELVPCADAREQLSQPPPQDTDAANCVLVQSSATRLRQLLAGELSR